MEVEAMLRHFIAQLHYQDYLDSDSQFLIHFPNRSHQPNNRLCSLNVEERSIDEDFYRFVMGTDTFTLPESPNTPSPKKKPRKDRALRGKSSPTKSPDITETLMEQEIWRNFPEDLFEAVLSRLPVAAFFRFRSVCQKWNNLLTDSESFSEQCLRVPRADPRPWFYTITHENVTSGAAIYDPGAKKWHQRPIIPSLPAKAFLLPAASAGGLVCLHDIGHRNFYVCNPLTQSFRELPPPRPFKVWSRIAVGMTLNKTNDGYKILWIGCDGEYQVYDSRLGSWISPNPGLVPNREVRLPISLNFRSQAVSVGERLYFMRSYPDGLVEYDTGMGLWAEYTVPAPGSLGDRSLAEVEGKVVMVGLVTRNAATCVCVWELQRMTMLWKEVDRMPNVWCLEFYGKHVRMTCLGNKGLLMLSLRSRQANRLVTYDVATREWLKLPGCGGRKRHWIAAGTAFHPCLTATA